MEPIKHHAIKKRIYLFSFLLSAGLVVVLYAVCGIFPFGARSVLTGDMDRQFLPFYTYFKTVFTTRADFSYTFAKTLGGDMPGFSAYYLHNPLLFILFLFPGDKAAAGIELLILLQVALCGLSASVLLNNLHRPSYHSLIFSTAYSGIGFLFGYMVLTIYFSNLALLPLVILYYLKFLDKTAGRLPFILLTSLYLFMSYYLGYMLMLFLAILYISRLIRDLLYIRRLPELFLSVVTALCLDGVFLFMTVFSLRGEKSSLTADLSVYRKFKLADFFAGFYAGNENMSMLPVIYCSLTAFSFMLLYFFGKRPLREKISSLFIVLALFLSMWINLLDAIWHGFNNPVGFPYRYAYLLSGTVIFLGYRGYLEIWDRHPAASEEKTDWRLFFPFGLLLLFPVALFLLHRPDMSLKRLILNLAVLLLVMLTVFLGRKRKYALPAFLVCLIVTCAELSVSAVSSYLAYNADKKAENLPLLSDHCTQVMQMRIPIDYVKDQDDGIYRIEKDFQHSPNDPMLFDYIGLSHYSSCEKDEVKHFMERMGFRDTGIYAFYGEGSTAFADCFLGVKYYLSRFDETYKPYSYVTKAGDYHVYQNPYALPLAFPADRGLRKLDVEADNIFETQNHIAEITGGLKDEPVYEAALYDKEETEDEIRYTIHISDRLPLYCYFDTDAADSVQIFVNGEDRGPYFTDTHWNVFHAGLYDPGTELSIVVKRLGETFSISEECFYYENAQAIKDWYAGILQDCQPAEIEMKKSSRLSFDIEAPDHSYIVLSVPYDEGWRITRNGESVKPDKVLNALIAVPTGNELDGDSSVSLQHIEMKYVPEGFYPGIFFTLAALLFLAADLFFTHRKYRKRTGENASPL
ncbi:MAG: YfhO family protein [Lachnospiraceae bacterium]|nr:YfhO family protein [Lachnospiraceae bacterium]